MTAARIRPPPSSCIQDIISSHLLSYAHKLHSSKVCKGYLSSVANNVRMPAPWQCLPQEIHIAEIDGYVPEVSKQFFPGMAVGFSDPRVTVNICDGIK